MKLIKYTFLVFFAWALIACATLQKTKSSEQELENTMLWRVSKEGFQDAYLFGTIHLIPKEKFYISQSLQELVESTEAIYLELSLDMMNDPAQLMGLLSEMNMTGDQSIEDLVSAEDFSLIKEKFSELGMPFFIFQKMKPIFLSMMVQNIQGQMIEDYKSYELELWDLAKVHDKPILGLETISEQLGFFDVIPYTDQAKYLVSLIKSDGEGGMENSVLFEMYYDQDLRGLTKMIREEDPFFSEYEDVFLGDRNKSWVPKIIQASKEKSSLFAVGAGHLAGKDGLIPLLRAEGFEVNPIQNK